MKGDVKKVCENQKMLGKVANISKWLGTKDFLIGELTLIDFGMAYMTHFSDIFNRSAGTECPLMKHDNLKKHMERVFALPGVKERVTSEKFLNTPIVMPTCFPGTLLLK